MPAAPRVRQLRRDKLIFTLAIRTIRLHLEEEDRLLQNPQLRQQPDADLTLIHQHIDQWVGISAEYVTHKFHLAMGTALQLIGALQGELKRSILPQELRRMPLAEALSLPAELQGPPAAGEAQ